MINFESEHEIEKFLLSHEGYTRSPGYHKVSIDYQFVDRLIVTGIRKNEVEKLVKAVDETYYRYGSKKAQMQNYLNELKQFLDERIMSYDYFSKGSKIFLITNKKKYNLCTWLNASKRDLKEKDEVMLSILEGAKQFALKTSRITSNLKPENIIMGEGKELLIDDPLQKEEPVKNYVDYLYISPERVDDPNVPTRKSVCYVLGLLIYYIYEEKHLYSGEGAVERLQENKFPILSEKSYRLKPLLQELLCPIKDRLEDIGRVKSKFEECLEVIHPEYTHLKVTKTTTKEEEKKIPRGQTPYHNLSTYQKLEEIKELVPRPSSSPHRDRKYSFPKTLLEAEIELKEYIYDKPDPSQTGIFDDMIILDIVTITQNKLYKVLTNYGCLLLKQFLPKAAIELMGKEEKSKYEVKKEEKEKEYRREIDICLKFANVNKPECILKIAKHKFDKERGISELLREFSGTSLDNYIIDNTISYYRIFESIIHIFSELKAKKVFHSCISPKAIVIPQGSKVAGYVVRFEFAQILPNYKKGIKYSSVNSITDRDQIAFFAPEYRKANIFKQKDVILNPEKIDIYSIGASLLLLALKMSLYQVVDINMVDFHENNVSRADGGFEGYFLELRAKAVNDKDTLMLKLLAVLYQMLAIKNEERPDFNKLKKLFDNDIMNKITLKSVEQFLLGKIRELEGSPMEEKGVILPPKPTPKYVPFEEFKLSKLPKDGGAQAFSHHYMFLHTNHELRFIYIFSSTETPFFGADFHAEQFHTLEELHNQFDASVEVIQSNIQELRAVMLVKSLGQSLSTTYTDLLFMGQHYPFLEIIQTLFEALEVYAYCEENRLFISQIKPSSIFINKGGETRLSSYNIFPIDRPYYEDFKGKYRYDYAKDQEYFVPPEIILNDYKVVDTNIYKTASYMFGMTFYCVLVQAQIDYLKELLRIREGNYQKFLEITVATKRPLLKYRLEEEEMEKILSILMACFNRIPANRPSLSDLKDCFADFKGFSLAVFNDKFLNKLGE